MWLLAVGTVLLVVGLGLWLSTKDSPIDPYSDPGEGTLTPQGACPSEMTTENDEGPVNKIAELHPVAMAGDLEDYQDKMFKDANRDRWGDVWLAILIVLLGIAIAVGVSNMLEGRAVEGYKAVGEPLKEGGIPKE